MTLVGWRSVLVRVLTVLAVLMVGLLAAHAAAPAPAEGGGD